MNILLINHYAGSSKMGMEYRPFFMAREWIKDGHNVTIVSASYAHVRIKQPDVVHDFSEEMIGGIRYCWVKTKPYSGNGFNRLKNILTFSIKIYRKAHTLSRRYCPDVVIASSTYTYDNYAAYKIAKYNNAAYIYEVHDLWPLSPKELGGMSKYHPFIFTLQAAENYAYKNVDQLVSMLPNTLPYMESHGLDPEKWHYIPNAVHKNDWLTSSQLPNKHLDILQKLQKEGNGLLIYAGSFGIANDLDNLINAAVLLKKENIYFVIIGEGPEKNNLIRKVSKNDLQNVIFLDPVSKSKIPGILAFADILYIGLQNQPLFRFGISPNKILDYMMSGKPIIQAIEAGNNMVKEANCGISIKPSDPESLADAIQKLLKMPEMEREKLGINGKAYVIKNHDYDILAKKMIKIFGLKNWTNRNIRNW